jgi:hypothetical protein
MRRRLGKVVAIGRSINARYLEAGAICMASFNREPVLPRSQIEEDKDAC